MKRLRAFLLLPFFFVEVRVHAGEAVSCWGRVVPCAIKGEGAGHAFRAKGLELTLAADGLVEQRDESRLQLVRGRSLWKIDGAGIRIGTPYADFACADACQALLERREKSVILKALGGRWIVTRQGEKANPYQIVSGLQVEISEVGDAGRAEMEFPQSLPWAGTVEEWAGLFPGATKDFKRELVRFRPEWREAVEAVSALHAATSSRAIASHDADVAAAAARQKARERDDARLRELFRQKTGLVP